ncbi:hypothetical protein MNBD_GAMMA19-395 [hydrothermal vent metagenome]|uniref:Uncharacterized protein n=1 Tax=hydrothermal vent metagenome TaxID=652676 RepID=A0A3B1AEC6_9ZZZZ
MDIAHIPKSFWRSLSFCMVVATIGVLYIAYKSSSVSIEIADAKISLSSAISTTKEIKSNLEKENERLKKVNAEITEELRRTSVEVAKVIQNPAVEIETILDSWRLSSADVGFNKAVVSQKAFEQLNMQIQKVENAVKIK